MEVETVTSPGNSGATWGSDIKRKWKKRSKLEQQLLLALIIVVLILTALLLFIIIKHAVAPTKCKTPACLLAASRIAIHIDPTVDPCDDFFKFACGKFIESTHGDLEAAAVPKLKAQVQRQLEEIIEEPVKDDDHYLVKSQKQMFQACMNETAVEEESFDIFLKTLDALGGWPVALGYRWDERRFDWKTIVYELRKKGYYYGIILPVLVVPDPKNTDRYIAKIETPSVTPVKPEHKQSYIKYMTDIAVIFGADRGRAALEMERVFDFMENLRKVADKHSKDAESPNATAQLLANRFTVPEYEARNNDIEWLDYINMILDPVGLISNKDYVLFPTLDFSKDLFNLIHKTPKRVQANYLIWAVIENIMPYMTKEMKECDKKYSCLTNSLKKDEDRSKFCKEVRWSFNPSPSEIVFARRYLPKVQRDQVKEMVENIKVEFKTLLKGASWMDATSKQKALQKSDAIIDIIGAPRDYFNDAAFEQLPPGDKKFLEYTENGTYFEMIMSQNKRKADAHYFRIHMSVSDSKPDKFYELITTVNAMYSPPDNAMILPVAILQDVFYDAERPMYLNYGAIGGIIGHELTHGFGEMGSEFDKDGHEDLIWTDETKKGFKEAAKCVIDEAESFDMDGTDERINGTVTLEENIADYTGIKVAYSAYKKWIHQNGAEPYLTGIDYTPNQLFWISSISYECFQSDKTSLRKDGHAENSFRATAPMRNNFDFANDFSCPSGSKMNPPEKCQVI